MSHVAYVGAAYGASAVALAVLLVWTLLDRNARRRELAELEVSGVRRRSDRDAV
ncbi:MAG: heme exporter protein CcmD [Rhizobiaceae bacterium]